MDAVLHGLHVNYRSSTNNIGLMGQHVAIYCRISQDRLGRCEGCEAQERQGRDYAASAWPGVPVVVYSDNDLSAASDDVVRPEYERLRQAIRDCQVAHLWAVEQSRLERREVEWFKLAAELDAAGIGELHTNRDGLIRVRDEVAGIKAVLNAAEVRKLTRRINDRLDDNAGQGLPPGSRPFGYARARNERGDKTYAVVPEQAEAIRWAAAQVLAGWSMSNVAAELRKRGLTGAHRVKVRDADGIVIEDDQGQPVTRPGVLSAQSVRSMITTPTVAGKRVHRGQIVGDGNWPAILSEDVWQACCAKLAAPRIVDRSDGGTYQVGTAHTGSTGRKYLLTGGLAVCGVCGAPLVGAKHQAAKNKPYLMCNARRGGQRIGKGCVGMMLPEVERYVVDELFAELDKPDFLNAIAADDHVGRRSEIIDSLSAVDAQRRELAELWGTPGGLTTAEWQAARGALADTERQLRAELGAKAAPAAVVDIDRVRAAWPVLDLGEQREFLRVFIEAVTIQRATPGRNGFDAGRVMITWRESTV